MNEQKLHPDFQTNPPDTEYFFIGSGKIQAAIQWSKHPECTPLGLIISRPEHFSRKAASHLFHPEFGLERTLVTVIIDGIRYKPSHSDLDIRWSEYEGVPNIFATWHAGDCTIRESFHTSPESDYLIRWVNIIGAGTRKVEVEAALYANPALFSSFGSDKNFLYAKGYDLIYLATKQQNSFAERFMKVIPEPFFGGSLEAHLIYSFHGEEIDINDGFDSEREYWEKTSTVIAKDKPAEILAAIFKAAKIGLHSAIAIGGRFDSSIWQYGMEWGRDASVVVEALVHSGQFELAKSVLQNILTKLSNDEGMIAEASRFRGGANSELDSNGLVLHSLQTYMEWTDDVSFIKEHWKRIVSTADFLLCPEFLDEETGMLKSSRDLWERMEAMGLKQGYDVAHQTFGIIGLEAASELAKKMGEKDSCLRWYNASEKMRSSFLSHPTHSMIENGKIIKRRLLDGQVQKELHVEREEKNNDFFVNFIPGGMPLAEEGKHFLEPDTAQSLPIIYGIVDPKSDVACSTMQDLEKLWSQAWNGGGYGRYDVSGEPDSPGPWPLATCLIAQAYFGMGENEKAIKAVNWLIEKAGSGGSWFEFYGERPTPPLPPVGILPWTWAQYITLVVTNILGAKVENGKIHLSARVDGLDAKLRFRNE